MLTDFINEPIIDFSRPEDKKAMEKAISKVNSELGRDYPLIIGGEKVTTDNRFDSINPAKTDEVIGTFSKCDKELADKAMDAALGAFETWSRVHPRERARYLLAAAQKMRERRFEFSAWMVVEESKSWIEAYGDTAEAIDFLDFYAREMMRLADGQPLTPYNGFETNLYYIPLGVGAVIPPWNFPNAIMAGMTSASIVAGNTVLLKPASTAPAIAYKFVELMEELMLPPGVLNFVPGSGAEIGDYIVDHPKTRFIAFTGSMEVGLRIVERAAKTSEGQIWIKRVIAEMGGKDFVLVDETADLDMSAQAIVTSAFGFQGQKCSAGSRAIIVESVYDEIAAKVVELTKPLKMGDPRNFAIHNGAVIDKSAYDKIMSYIGIGKEEGELL
ncbi:MAG: aldehyde dehydrogenase family protein, partial [bacterium]|nr:aldehyde dehydrogenase family protein [bacterium]